ncbi:MAG: flagellar hook-length control protein FliK, partial [Beijerinckiaceae bacterium]
QIALGQGLQPGQTVLATVTGALPDGRLSLLLDSQAAVADLRGAALPGEARQPGAVLRLQVETSGAVPRLVFAGLETPVRPSGALPQAQASAAQTSVGSTAPQQATRGSSSTLSAAPSDIRIVAQQSVTDPQVLARVAHNPVAETITRAAVDAASRQGSAAPLYADLAEALNRPQLGLPQAVRALAGQLLANRLNGDVPITSIALKDAVLQTGVLQEALAGRAISGAPDAKALLTALRDILRSDTVPALRQSPDAEPPRRDGAVVGQRAAFATLGPQAGTDSVSATLAREADQAVGRITLHQIASLPPERALLVPPPLDLQRPQQLSFEIPLALGQQTAIAGFRIERERKRAANADKSTDVWGVRFAIDADVLGPVHAHVRLAGQTLSVSLWAEDPGTHRIFVEAIPRLEAALAENAFDIGTITILPGKPAENRPGLSGHFLDRRS